jgi:hypothetical protein
MAGFQHGRKVFDGWEHYPGSLFEPALDTDANQCKQRLDEEARRLFIPPEEACELESQGFLFVDGALYAFVRLNGQRVILTPVQKGKFCKQEKQTIVKSDDLENIMNRKYSTQIL